MNHHWISEPILQITVGYAARIMLGARSGLQQRVLLFGRIAAVKVRKQTNISSEHLQVEAGESLQS